MGMLVIVINGMVLQSVLENNGIFICLIFVFIINQVVEFYICCCVICYLEKGCVVIFSVGIGSFYFIIDLVVVLCVNEIGVEVILKGIWVDGIYIVDLEKDFMVICFEIFIFDQVLSLGFNVMDVMVFMFCQENDILIIVFDINDLDNFKWIVEGEQVGMLVV